MKALNLLKTNQSVQERAKEFAQSIKRNLQKTIIDTLTDQIEEISDQVFELSNFTLGADLNAGMVPMTRQDCEDRFSKLINLRYEKKLLEVELEEKKKAFDEYFCEEEEVA